MSDIVLNPDGTSIWTDAREKLEAVAGYEALAAKKHHYTELCGEEESLRVKKDSMQGLFRVGLPEAAGLQRCRREAEEAAILAGELRSYRLDSDEMRELERLEARFEQGVPDRGEIQECIRGAAEGKEALRHAEQIACQEEGKAEHAKKLKRLCCGFAVLCLLLAIGCGILGVCGKGAEKAERMQVTGAQDILLQETEKTVNPVLFGFGGALVLAAGVLFVCGLRNKKEERKASDLVVTYSGEMERLRGQGKKGRELLIQYGVAEDEDITGALYRLSEEAGRYEALSLRNDRRKQCLAQREALLQGCSDLLAGYGLETEDIAGSLHILETRTRDFIRISEAFEEAVKKREQFERETPPESFYGLAVPEIGFAQLQQTEQELLARIAGATEEEKDCRDRAEAFEEEAEAVAELEELCKELSERLDTKKREYFFVTETMKCLKTAKEQFSSRYLRGLTNGFEKYITLLGEEDLKKSMDGHFNGVRPDINLNVQVTAYGEEKELGYFSAGTKDIIGLCMRFALVDALFAEEQPFLVLDDPFVNLDQD